jgi:hypothetical protein
MLSSSARISLSPSPDRSVDLHSNRENLRTISELGTIVDTPASQNEGGEITRFRLWRDLWTAFSAKAARWGRVLINLLQSGLIFPEPSFGEVRRRRELRSTNPATAPPSDVCHSRTGNCSAGYALRFLNCETENFALVSVVQTSKLDFLPNFTICELEAAPTQQTDAASRV